MTDNLTGRSRVRAHKSWGKVLLVLQVEVKERHLKHRYPRAPLQEPEYKEVICWRDATVEDLIVEDGKCS